MITAIQRCRPFKCPQIGNILNHNQHGRVTARVEAYDAGIGSIDIAAGRADPDLLRGIFRGNGKWLQQGLFFLDQMQGRAAGRTRAKTRQPGQNLDQSFNFWAGNGFDHYIPLKTETSCREELANRRSVPGSFQP